MPDPKIEKRRKIYDNASKSFDVGTYEEFNKNLSNPETRKKIYKNLSTKFDSGTYEEFEAAVMPVQKKSEDESLGTKDLSQPTKVQKPLSVSPGTNKAIPSGGIDFSKEPKVDSGFFSSESTTVPTQISEDQKKEMQKETLQSEIDQKKFDEEKRIRKEKLTTNPLISFYESGKDALVNQVPGALAAAWVAMAPDYDLRPYNERGAYTNPEEEARLARESTKKAKESAIKFAMERFSESEKTPVIRSLQDIDDPLDLVNFIMSSIGQSSVQIPLTIGTAGASGAGQEIGGAYMDGINEVAKKNNITPLEVIQNGDDDKVIPVISGIIAGSLDFIGARGVADAINVDALTKSLRKRAIAFLAGMTKEALTEGAQSAVVKTGTAISTEDNISDVAKKVWDGRMEVVDEMAAGFFGAGGVQAGGAVLNKTPERSIKENVEVDKKQSYSPGETVELSPKKNEEINTQGEATENIPEQQVPVSEEATPEVNELVSDLTSKRSEIIAGLPIDEKTGQPVINEETQRQLSDINNQINAIPKEEADIVVKEAPIGVEAGLSEETKSAIDKEINFQNEAPQENVEVAPIQEQQLNDTQNIEGVQSDLGGRKEPVQAKSVQTTSNQEAQAGGVLQEPGSKQEEGVVPPETPDELNLGSLEPKKRKFIEQIKNDPDISDEFKQGITEDTENYVPTSNTINNKEADAFIEANGADSALEKLSDTNNDMKPKARVSVASKLIKNFNKVAKEATTEVDKKANLDKAIKTADFIAKHLTEMGQGVQAASMYSKLSPEGVLRYVQREVNKTRKTKIDRIAPKLKANKEVIDKINKDSVKKVLSSPRIKNILEGKIKEGGENRKKAVKKATDFLEGLKINTKGKASDITFLLPAYAWNGSISTIQKSLELGLTVVEAIDAAVKYVKANHKEEWNEQGFRKKFSASLSKYEAAIDPSGATKKGIKDLDIKIGEVVEQHYTKVDKAKKTLTQRILDNTDLTDVDAKEIARNIESEFDKLTSDAKKKALLKSLSFKSILPNSKERRLYNDIIRLSNLGALSESEWQNFYAKKFDLPELTTEQAQKLMSLSEKVQEAKEGEQKNKATQDLLAYQEKIKGINWADVGSSIWYANILSGLSTQTTNAFSGFMEIMGELAVSVVRKPKNTGFLLSNLFQGWGRGGLVGLDVLKTGYQPEKGSKIEAPANLERIKFKGGKWNPFNYSKYVSRLMTAVDIFHYQGLKQMRAAELALTLAAKEGKNRPNKEIKNRAIEILYKSKERIAEAKQQATDEGLTGKEFKRRVYELVEQSRPEQINEDASDFAAHGTFNYEPEGIVGALAGAVNGASTYSREIIGVNPIQFIVPFTRVVANVMNRSLDWTPHGYVRALKGGMGSGKYGENKWSTKYTPEERQRELIKATLGTIAMATLWAMTDDEDGLFEITADGTGDTQKNYELQETGWRPYSIKIGDKWYNYQNTPLSIPFANIGFARDAMKYKGEKDITSKISIAMFGGSKYMMDMSFLGSLAGFFGAFSKDNPNGGQGFMAKITKESSRTAKSFVVPNLFTQASRSLQEIYDLPMKRANGIMDELVRDMPVLRDNLDNMYNTLGDPIIADQNRKFIPFKIKGDENDKVWDLIIENQAFIGSPSKSTIVYDPKTDTERELTDKEYNVFALKSGKLIKKMILEEYSELKKMSKGEIRERIKGIKKEARDEIKSNLLN